MSAAVTAIMAVITMNRINQDVPVKISLNSSKQNKENEKKGRHWRDVPVSEEKHWDK